MLRTEVEIADDYIDGVSHVGNSEEKSAITHRLADTDSLNFMTYNVACLPSKMDVKLFGYTVYTIHKQLNTFLRPNLERANGICDAILLWNQAYHSKIHTQLTMQTLPQSAATIVNQFLMGPQHEYKDLFPAEGIRDECLPPVIPDVIAFQEAFDPEIRDAFVRRLAPFYPNHTATIEHKDHFWQIAGAGLMLFTKSPYKILDVFFQPFKFELPGEEIIVDKGFLGIKVAFGSHQYKTIYTTHLPGGGAVFKELFKKFDITTSEVRGMALNQIYRHIAEEKWSDKPIAAYPELTNAGTYNMGDFNIKLNAPDEMAGIGKGMSANGKVRGFPKYPGQFRWAGLFAHNAPENFIESRALPIIHRKKKPDEKISKIYMESALQEAKEKGLFIGSTIRSERLQSGESIEPFNKASTEPKMIDGIFVNKEADVNIRTRLFAGLGNYSDHYALFGWEEKKDDSKEVLVDSPLKLRFSI